MHTFLIKLRCRWALGITAGVLLLYSLLGFVLVPYLARSAIDDYAHKLGLRSAVGGVWFNPYTFNTEISDLQLSADGGAPLVGFKRLWVDFEPVASALARAFVFEEVRLVRPDVTAIIERDGGINLAKLAPPSDASAEAQPTQSTALPSIQIDTLALDDGRVLFEDRSRAKPFSIELTPLRFALNHFRTTGGHHNRYQFVGATESGARFAWKGQLVLTPLASEGSFQIEGVKVATLDAYLQEQLPLQLAAGVIDFVAGHYRFAAQPELTFDLTVPSFALSHFAVTERGSSEPPPVEIPSLAVHDVVFSLTQRSVHVRQVGLDGTRISVRREADQSINLTRLTSAERADSAKPTSHEPEQEAVGEPWRIAVERVRVREASVHAQDRAVTPAVTVALSPLNLAVDGYSTDPDARLNTTLDVTVDNKGKLHTQGTAQLLPLHGQFAIQLQELDLSVGQPYVAQLSHVVLHQGTLGVTGDASFVQPKSGKTELHFKGDATVDDLLAREHREHVERPHGRPGDDDLTRWKRMTLSGIDYQMSPDKLDIDTVAFEGLFGRVVINPDQSLNVSQLMKKKTPTAADPQPPSVTENKNKKSKWRTEKAASAASQPAQPAETMPIRIGRILVNDSSAFFADRSIEPAFSAGIVKLHGGVHNVSSDPSSRSDIALDGQIDKYAPVQIRGTSNLFDPTRYCDVKLTFSNIQLPIFNPYSGKYAGYNISKGLLTTQLSYKIDLRRLKAEHHVVLDQLEFGEATNSKDAAPWPIRFAVALLKDRYGVIDLDLPVRGSLDDPKLRYSKLIWKVLGNIVMKIVTAPFAALGALFGGGGDELGYVDFAPGVDELSPQAHAKLDQLGKALVERPGLKLDLPAITGDPDREGLARQALARQLPPRTAPAGKSHLRALEKLYEKLNRDDAEYPDEVEGTTARIAYLEGLLAKKLTPSEDAMNHLGQRRAKAVQDALLARPELTPDRIFIVNGVKAAKGENGALRMELKLE